MSARDRIKAALDEIDGVAGFNSEPPQKLPGAAWPVLRELSRDGFLAAPYSRAYDVFAVIATTSPEVSAAAAEELIVELVEALEPLGEWVQPAETVQIAFDNNSTVPGIRVRIIPDPEEGD